MVRSRVRTILILMIGKSKSRMTEFFIFARKSKIKIGVRTYEDFQLVFSTSLRSSAHHRVRGCFIQVLFTHFLFIFCPFSNFDFVLKKEKSKFKTEIKLDTNIQIKIDVDAPDAASEYIERGFDEDKKMKFYKVYYNAEK